MRTRPYALNLVTAQKLSHRKINGKVIALHCQQSYHLCWFQHWPLPRPQGWTVRAPGVFWRVSPMYSSGLKKLPSVHYLVLLKTVGSIIGVHSSQPVLLRSISSSSHCPQSYNHNLFTSQSPSAWHNLQVSPDKSCLTSPGAWQRTGIEIQARKAATRKCPYWNQCTFYCALPLWAEEPVGNTVPAHHQQPVPSGWAEVSSAAFSQQN